MSEFAPSNGAEHLEVRSTDWWGETLGRSAHLPSLFVEHKRSGNFGLVGSTCMQTMMTRSVMIDTCWSLIRVALRSSCVHLEVSWYQNKVRTRTCCCLVAHIPFQFHSTVDVFSIRLCECSIVACLQLQNHDRFQKNDEGSSNDEFAFSFILKRIIRYSFSTSSEQISNEELECVSDPFSERYVIGLWSLHVSLIVWRLSFFTQFLVVTSVHSESMRVLECSLFKK